MTSDPHRKLTPRATAVLVALRSGSRRLASMADAIADDSTRKTAALLADMVADGLIRAYGPPGRSRSWGLTSDGLAWLQTRGLDAARSVKDELDADTNPAQVTR